VNLKEVLKTSLILSVIMTKSITVLVGNVGRCRAQQDEILNPSLIRPNCIYVITEVYRNKQGGVSDPRGFDTVQSEAVAVILAENI
jgi:hypothetical protein